MSLIRRWRHLPGHFKILAGLLAGAGLGGVLNALYGGDSSGLQWVTKQISEPIGLIFLRLLLMLVIPLVFCSLALGVAGIGDIRRLGRVGIKCLAYTVIISAISVVIGLTFSNVIRPGKRIDPEVSQRLQAQYADEAEAKVNAAVSAKTATPDAPLMTVVKTIVPTNVMKSVSQDPPDMIGLMFFALFFGVLLTLIGEKADPVLRLLEGLYEAISKGIELVMLLAPYAVFALLFTMTARFGFSLLISLGWFAGTVLGGLGLHLFGVYSLSLIFLSKIPPLEFFRRIRTVMITAFSTSSSNATLPTALRESEQKLGVPRDINAFVLTIGATANQNGTALFEGLTVLFLAQFAGVELTLGQQLIVLYMAILGGIGTAGVPAASLPFIVVVLSTLGINPALIALVIGVDRILDMCRTVVNVVGDLTAVTYIARSEGATLLPPLAESSTGVE